MVSFASDIIESAVTGKESMPEGLLPILLIIAGIILYALIKIVENVRKSEQQWEQVDKSKLKEWDDEDD
ncbi:MAG: hypothetical protein ACR2QS_08525 [Woeseiaceae bacterium]